MNATDQTASDVGVGYGALFGISGCDNCPFNDAKYCKLLQWLASESGTEANAWVCDEWRAGTMPEKCPLKKRALTFVPNVQSEPRLGDALTQSQPTKGNK